MAGELDSLIIRLAAETADAQRSLRRMENRVDKFADNSTKSIRRVDAAFAAMASRMNASVAGLLSTLAGAATIGFFDRLARETNSMADLGESVGMTTRQFQEFQTLLIDQGMDLNRAQGALQSFSARVGELRAGMGSLHGFLKKTNAGLIAQLAATNSTQEALRVLEQALEAETNATDRNALAKAAFTKANVQLGMILAQTGSQIDRGAEVAREYGTVINDEAIAATRAWQREVDLLAKALNANLIPTLTRTGAQAISYARTIFETIRKGASKVSFFYSGFRNELSPEVKKSVEDEAKRVADFAMPALAKAMETKGSRGAAGGLQLPPWEVSVVPSDESANAFNEKLQNIYSTAESANKDFIANVKDSYRGVEFIIEDAIARPLNDAFEGNLQSAKEYFRSVLQGMANLIVQSQILQPLLKSITNSLSGGGTTTFGSLLSGTFGSFFGGFRASGGPVSPNRAYVVGEKGPELMVPNAAGVVMPNRAMAGVGGQTVYNIDARGAAPGVEERIYAALARLEKERPSAPQQMAAYGGRFPLRQMQGA